MKRIARKPKDGIVIGQPFDTSVSANHRIPCLVWHKGEWIAACDARWDHEKDGGGLDLVVSRSADGATWNYTFPGYLGDNGNVWDPDSSTLMDPVIISGSDRLYLLADLFPAGYSISSTSTTHVFSDPAAPFNQAGELLLSDDGRETFRYCLKNDQICTLDGEQTGYYIRDWFDLYDRDDKYVSNLFFADSPYQPRAASFICMTTSDDGGRTWSAPVLLNLKKEGTLWMILGPGAGLVTQDEKLAFTAYDGSHIYLVHGDGEIWDVVKTDEASNESSIVELKDGTIRAFVKRGGINTIAYVDFTKNGREYTAGALVDTGVENFSHCMVSAHRCWEAGREVILVCCPSDAAGGLWAGRFNGMIYAYELDAEKNMIFLGNYQLNHGFFAYSSMAQNPDGILGVLYEDDCISYRAGNYEGTASHITFRKVDIRDILK